MNEQQLTRSERIASRIMRLLAVIGLVSILAIAAWLIVQGVRLLPQSGDGLVAAVTSLFKGEVEESLVFTRSSTTYTHGDQTTFSWTYVSENPTTDYTFAYTCAEGLSFSVFQDAAWSDLACDTPLTLTAPSITVTPTATHARFTDVTLSVRAGTLSAKQTITVINSAIAAAALPSDAPTVVGEPVTTQPVRPAPQPVTPAAAPRPTVRTPADLAVHITGTGVLADVAGKDTFFPIDPIPSDRTAAVTFTVTNVGGTMSDSWSFVANLPIEGDVDYRYASPVQAPLEPGAQVEFMLGFDEVLEEKSGMIRITLVPRTNADKDGNNADATRVTIR